MKPAPHQSVDPVIRPAWPAYSASSASELGKLFTYPVRAGICDGQAFEYEIADPEVNSYKIKFWYENGKPAVEGSVVYKDEQSIYDAKAWDRQGQAVTDNTQINDIVEDIYKN